jgi:hypothetical protein
MRLTREEAEQQRELNKLLHVLVEAAQCLQARAMMLEQLERQRHYAEIGPTRESDGVAFERADRTRRVAAFLASTALRDTIKNEPALAALLLGPAGPSCNGTDFLEPRLPKPHDTWRPIQERLGS